MTRLDKPDEALEWLESKGPRQLQVWYPNGDQPLGVLVFESNTMHESEVVVGIVKSLLERRKADEAARKREEERAQLARIRGPELLAKARAVCEDPCTPVDRESVAALKELIREIDEPEVNLIGGGT